MGTLVVLAGLIVIVGLIIRSMVRDRKQGTSGCGGDCSRCHGCVTVHTCGAHSNGIQPIGNSPAAKG